MKLQLLEMKEMVGFTNMSVENYRKALSTSNNMTVFTSLHDKVMKPVMTSNIAIKSVTKSSPSWLHKHS